MIKTRKPAAIQGKALKEVTKLNERRFYAIIPEERFLQLKRFLAKNDITAKEWLIDKIGDQCG